MKASSGIYINIHIFVRESTVYKFLFEFTLEPAEKCYSKSNIDYHNKCGFF